MTGSSFGLRTWMSLCGLWLITACPAGLAAESRSADEVVDVGRDARLATGRHAESVVAVIGDVHVSGTVKDGAVAVLGTAYIDGQVGGDAVAVLGDVRLGPNARVDGSVVAVGGRIERDPSAIVRGDLQSIGIGHFTDAGWMRAWVRHCLIFGRPLSVASGLDWAWGLAFAFWALYLGIASLFGEAVGRCARSFETDPARVLLAALLGLLMTPVLIVLLCITVIGIVAVPFVGVIVVCAALFGKAGMLAWLGRRVTARRATDHPPHPAVAVVVGGAVVLACYVVPVIGFLVFTVLSVLGLGAAFHALIVGLRPRQPVGAEPSTASTTAQVPPAAMPESPRAPPDADAMSVLALPRAGFWVRMAALLIDLLVVGAVMHVLHGSRLQLAALAAYGAVMWKVRGSSVGGIVLDLRVVRSDGRTMDWQTAIVRALGCFLSLAAMGLGFFWIAFDPSKQAWHDKIAGTVVVRVPKSIPITRPLQR